MLRVTRNNIFSRGNFVDQRPNFEANNWSVDEALFWIFFSNEQEMRRQRRRHCRSITKWLNTNTNQERTENSPLDSGLDTLEKLRSKLPRSDSGSPLLWIRFAFSALRAGIAPTDYFFRQYANWRFLRSRRYGTETIARVLVTGDKEIPHISKIEGEEIEGFLFDRFFLMEKPISEIEWNSEWKHFSFAKLPKPRGPRTDICAHVGRNAFHRIEIYVTLAAKEGRIVGLSKQRRDQKYSADMTRAELAEALQRRYRKQLDCASSTIIRSLSHLVKCRKR